jgi:hypothetical protein
MTEFFSRKYGNKGYEVIIKTDCHEHYRASEEFARRLIGHAKPVTDNNYGRKWIPVTERLPKAEDANSFGEIMVWLRSTETQALWKWKRAIEHPEAISHWMHLPEPPKEVE